MDAMAGKPLPGRRTCRVATVLAGIREVDEDVAAVLEVGIADERISQGQLSVLFRELGYNLSSGIVGHHRRGLRGEKGRNGCRCKT